MLKLTGAIPVLPTIFTSSGAPDEGGMRRVLDYVIGAGASGVVFPGLASEYDMLAVDERLHLTGLVGAWIGERVPFIVGASARDADQAIAYAKAGTKAGAVVAMILTPHAYADDMEAMARFYRDAHEGSGIAIMLQNAPAPMGVGLPLEQVAELARKVEAIRYVKEEAMPSGQRITRLMALAGDRIDGVYGGAGARYVIDELARGAEGTMPACEITELHVAMVDRYLANDETAARTLFERTLPLLSMQAVFRWRLTKAVLQKRGLIDSAFVRAPGPELDRYDRAELDALLARIADLLPFDAAMSAALEATA